MPVWGQGRGSTFVLQPPQLEIAWPDGSRQRVTLGRDPLRVGREAETNDIVVPEALTTISRHHLEVQPLEEGYQVVDLGSANGVFVNGQRVVGSALLSSGDEIRLGDPGQDVRLVYRAGSPELLARIAQAIPGTGTDLAGFLASPPASGPYLRVRWPDGQEAFFPIEAETTLIGRSPDAALRVPEGLRFVSAQHAAIRHAPDGFQIVDLGSTNGTRVNSRPLTPHTPEPLQDADIVRIGDETYGVSIGLTFHDPAEEKPPIDGLMRTLVGPIALVEESSILIGRAPECDVVLDAPTVSRQHARIEQAGDGYRIVDLVSANGTFVNGQPVETAPLRPGDLIQIEQFVLQFIDGRVVPYQSHGMRVDAVNLTKDVRTRRGPLRILHGVSLTVMPRDFVAVVGGSGAGKSTLMGALIGTRRADGRVELNGRDFYAEYERFRSQLGYVPQADILHTTLTVEQALDYAARMRLPGDVPAGERRRRIDAVLDTVDMNTETIRQTRIGNLSGGQRKRVSIAAELLADPKLIYLDEATSGLDPGLEKKMMHTLRRMADEGRTVVLITHATSNIVQADHVALLADGRLVYFGPPQDALSFFGVDEFADIYERVEGRGEEWEGVFREERPEYYQQYILGRQATRQAAAKSAMPRISFGLGGFLRQLAVLTQRAISILRSDLVTLALLLLLFPLTATLQLVISTPDIMTGDLAILADPVAAARKLTEAYIPIPDLNIFVFVMGLEAVLVGMYVPSNELIKERTVYLRERMVNLRVAPYLLSKVSVYTLFAAIQTALYLLVLSLGVRLPEQGLLLPGPVELFITLFLTMVASMGLGFVVSAISRSSEMATYVLVILMFFQFFFAGTVFDLRDNPAEPLSYFTTTRWSLTALGVTIDMEKQAEATILCPTVPDDSPLAGMDIDCFNYPDAKDDLMLPYDDRNLPISWGVLVGMAAVYLGVAGLMIKRLDRAGSL